MSKRNGIDNLIQLRVRVDPEVVSYFRAQARRRRKTVSTVAREVLDRGLKSYVRTYGK